MNSYEKLRQQYRPDNIDVLLIAESPPPSAEAQGSRHFYRSQTPRRDDRLFLNTIKAVFSETEGIADTELEETKEHWLQRFKDEGFYMIEALETSLQHKVTKPQRQEKIKQALPRLIERVGELASPATGIVLIKSNVFDVAAEPLREAGFNVLNTGLVDYPGFYNQKAYREKLRGLVEGLK